MSYTTLHKVPAVGEIEVIAEFPNAWRGAFHIWESLWKRYIPTPFSLSNPQPLWDLYKDSRLSLNERITLMSTFDKVMVRQEHIPLVISAFKEFSSKYGDSSLPEQVVALEGVVGDETCFAVCWTQTSVADDIWHIYEDGDMRMYNISIDTGHWFMFDNAPEAA